MRTKSKATQRVILEDPATVAFIQLHSPTLQVTQQRNFSGRIGFCVEGTDAEIQGALIALSDNVPIGARDLLEAIKRTRQAMFAAKAAAQGVRHE